MTLYTPTLHRLPDDTAGRFAVLHEFLRGWHGLATGGVGRTVERVAAAEARIKLPLPLAVREWIVLLDDLDRGGGWSQVLRDCWSLCRVPGCAAFSLLVQGEADRHWGPLLRDLADADPPTHLFDLDDDDKFKRVRRLAPRVSTWAVEFIVSYLHLSRSVQSERLVSRATLDRLRTDPPPGVFATQVGATELVEFDGGLVHADPEGPDAYTLRCFQPWRAATDDGYYAAQAALGQRVEALLGVTCLPG